MTQAAPPSPRRATVSGPYDLGRTGDRAIGDAVTPPLGVDAATSLSEEELDNQPYGVIRLDRDGNILSFNRHEEHLSRKRRADVLWKNFFMEVAPCTQVRELHGRFVEGVRARRMNVTVGFVFRFPHRTRYVDISLFYKESDDSIWLIIRDDGKPPSSGVAGR